MLNGPPQLRLDGFDDAISDPDRDTWVTAKWIADAVGEFDIDCCTNPRAHIRALKKFMLENGQDGIALARYVGSKKRVWCNPPYSRGQVIQWVRAYGHTRFCFLVRADFSTDWMVELLDRSELILIPKNRRIDFEPPPGAKASSNPYPHLFAYARAADATPAIRELCYAFRPDFAMPAPNDTVSRRATDPLVYARRQLELWMEIVHKLEAEANIESNREPAP